MASQLLTAGVGFVFWVIAARNFSEASVGFAAAAISGMSLIGAIATVGLGTLLIREMPSNRGKEFQMLSAALIISGGLGAAMGAVFVWLAPMISVGFRPLTSDPIIIVAVVVGSGLTAAAWNIDEALIGLFRSHLQLMRNLVSAVGRLGFLVVAVLVGVGAGSVVIVGSWSLALAASLGVLAMLALARGQLSRIAAPAWGIIRELRGSALRHHLLNLCLLAPGWLMPLITLSVLSAATNARFYLMWMLVGLASFVPTALTYTLYAASSHDRASLAEHGRITLSLSLLAAAGGFLVLWIWGAEILSVLGGTYAVAAQGPLPVLALTLFPVAVKSHFVTIHRVHGTLIAAALFVLGGAVIEVAGAIVGAHIGNLMGLSLGLLIATAVEGAVMWPTVQRAIFRPHLA